MARVSTNLHVSKYSEWGDFHVVGRKSKEIDGKTRLKYKCQCTYYTDGCVKYLSAKQLSKKPLCPCKDQASAEESKGLQADPIPLYKSDSNGALVPTQSYPQVEYTNLPVESLSNSTKKKLKSNWDYMNSEGDSLSEVLHELSTRQDANSKFAHSTIIRLWDAFHTAYNEYKRRPTQSYAYAMNSFVAQIRELMADLDSDKMQHEAILNIVMSAFQEFFREMGRYLINGHYEIQKVVKSEIGDAAYVGVKDKIDHITQTMAANCENAMQNTKDSILAKMAGDETLNDG